MDDCSFALCCMSVTLAGVVESRQVGVPKVVNTMSRKLDEDRLEFEESSWTRMRY